MAINVLLNRQLKDMKSILKMNSACMVLLTAILLTFSSCKRAETWVHIFNYRKVDTTCSYKVVNGNKTLLDTTINNQVIDNEHRQVIKLKTKVNFSKEICVNHNGFRYRLRGSNVRQCSILKKNECIVVVIYIDTITMWTSHKYIFK